MQITEQIHAIKIPFSLPISPEMNVDRFAFVYFVFGEKIHLIDSGVAGADSIIWEYIETQGREPDEISTLILTHSHPDHIGSAKSIRDRTYCNVFAHPAEQDWIEDTVINHCIEDKDLTIMALCKKVVKEQGLPPFAAMPLVANALSSSLVA